MKSLFELLNFRGRLALVSTLLGCFLSAAVLAAPPPQPLFDAGVAQYRKAQYAAALQSFQRAEAAGMQGPNLRFNLGLAYYKLGRDAEARAQFEALRSTPDYAPMADYHLGLIAARGGDRDGALLLLRRAEAHAATPQLRALARSTIARLSNTSAQASSAIYISAGGGYDSNPVLLADDTNATNGEDGDAYAELLGVLSVPLVTGASGNLLGEGSLYAREYQDVSDFSQQAGQLGLRYQRDAGKWQMAVIGQGEASFVGGDSFQNAGSVGIEWLRFGSRANAKIQLQSSRIAGGDGYEYLDGWRHRFAAEYAPRLASGRLRLGYDLEYNDRDDLTDGTEFFSRSPLRNRVSARWSAPISDRWSLELGARYRNSRYADPDRFLDNATLREKRRSEQLGEGMLGLRYRLGQDWSLLTQYQYQHNHSNFDSYSYERQSGLLAIEWTAADF